MANCEGVAHLVSKFETQANQGKGPPAPAGKSRLSKCWASVQRGLRAFLKSRLMGLVLGPAYGFFIYLYITNLILSGAPFTKELQATTENETSRPNQSLSALIVSDVKEFLYIDQDNARNETQEEKCSRSSSNEPKFVPLMTTETSHLIGKWTGTLSGSGLTLSSLFSTRIRCSLALMVPSLLTKRGRAFMLTFVTSLVLKGPVDTIQFNLQEVVRTQTCLYEGFKSLSQRCDFNNKKILNYSNSILDVVNEVTKEQDHQLKLQLEKANTHQKETIRKIKEQHTQSMNEAITQIENLKQGWNTAKTVETTFLPFLPGLAGVAATGIGYFMDAAVNAPKILDPNYHRANPAVGISIKSDESLKQILKSMEPNKDILDIDLKGLKDKINASSIKSIRDQMKALFNDLMDLCKIIVKYGSKIFYVAIIFVIVDAIKYQRGYYTDNDFDNKMVDGNLRNLWKKEGYRKLTPLRKWETEKEEVLESTSFKLAREEAKKLIVQSFPTILATVVIVGIIIVDQGFTMVLKVFEENAKFGIHFPGMEQGVSFTSFLENDRSFDPLLKIKAFDLSTDPCLPRSKQSDAVSLGPIFAILVVCFISCVVEAYFSRLRAIICSIFYPVRANERAKYLHK